MLAFSQLGVRGFGVWELRDARTHPVYLSTDISMMMLRPPTPSRPAKGPGSVDVRYCVWGSGV